MKILSTILIAISINSASFAQYPDPALARVYYKFSHMRDTTDREQLFEENMVLVVGKNVAVYLSYDRLLQADRLADFLKLQTKANGGTLTNVVMQKGLIKKVSNTDYYTYTGEKKAFATEYIMMNKYLIPEDLAPVKWTIKQDTMSFSGIICRKATSYFKGRNWIAWYAVDLAFASGPWKLNGLPGLIIEAYDERKEVQFKFDGLTNVNEQNTVTKDDFIKIGTGELNFSNNFYLGREIKLPTDAIKATREEIIRLRQALSENPKAGSTGQIAATATANSKNAPISNTLAKNKFNNPIELSEKK